MSDRLDGWAAANRPSGRAWDISTAQTQSIPVQGTPAPGTTQGMPAQGTPGVPTKPAPYRRGEETLATPALTPTPTPTPNPHPPPPSTPS
ncbi:LytR family transcriptional regulator, partial [Streptomyces sp. DSM 41602]|nr:LytR family transcriptional regulator [Streptomyces sp. DSM 41602]